MKLSALIVIAGGGALLASCGEPRPQPLARAPIVPIPTAGLQNVMGQNAAGLVRALGQPDADLREGSARKLQFKSAICILDAYLYPKGSAEPRVTWIDTRQRDGSPIDRASCVAALSRRDGGK